MWGSARLKALFLVARLIAVVVINDEKTTIVWNQNAINSYVTLFNEKFTNLDVSWVDWFTILEFHRTRKFFVFTGLDSRHCSFNFFY